MSKEHWSTFPQAHEIFPSNEAFYYFVAIIWSFSLFYTYWTGPLPLGMDYIPNPTVWPEYSRYWNYWLYPRPNKWKFMAPNDIYINVDFTQNRFRAMYHFHSHIWNYHDRQILQMQHEMHTFLYLSRWKDSYWYYNEGYFSLYTEWVHFQPCNHFLLGYPY